MRLLTLSILFLCCLGFLFSEEDSCHKEATLVYFPEPFVRKTLESNHVEHGKVDAIVQELLEKNSEVMQLSEEKMAKLKADKKDDRSYNEKVVAAFREALKETFTSVLEEHGVKWKLDQMLDEIQLQKAENFKRCFDETPQSEGRD